MDQRDESLSSECERALEFHTRSLLGESLAALELQQLSQHLAVCPACLSLKEEMSGADAALDHAFAAVRATPKFAARTLAALPAAPELKSHSSDNAPRIFTAAPVRRSWAARLSVAAALVAGLLVAWAASNWKTPVQKAIVVRSGQLLDPNGQLVSQLKPGTVYTVQSDSVVPLSDASVLKVKEGAEFQVMLSADTGEAALQLNSGDLFAWGRKDGDQKPLRVSCASFDTLLHAGDFFVAEDGSSTSASVVIVFDGTAQVTRDQVTLPLHAGQVFFVLGSNEVAIAQTLDISDAMARMHEIPAQQHEDLSALRRVYEKQIQGYQQELASLDRKLAQEQNEKTLAELRKRKQLVLAYRDAHQEKLKTLWLDFPNEELERGLRGHTDPTTWL